MSNATMERVRANLKRSAVEEKTSGNPDELAAINFELYPEEIVSAAADELGDKQLPQYIVDIYLFGLAAQQANSQVKKTQLQGLVLTHSKLTRWLESKGARHFLDLQNKAVLRAFLMFHERRLEESFEALRIISIEITK